MNILLWIMAAWVAAALILAVITYRRLFFRKVFTLEEDRTRCMERGEFDEAFLAMPWEDFQAESPHGYAIRGAMLKAKNPAAPLLLCVHGITRTRFAVYKFMRRFAAWGWHVAAIDLPGHGATGRQGRFGPSFGYYERADVGAALRAAAALLPACKTFGLLGESLGAACVIQHAGSDEGIKEAGEGRLSFVIADCPFTSIAQETDHRLAEDHIPSFLRTPAIALASAATKVLRGYWLHEASPEKASAKAPVPLLLVHGAEDRYVPTWMSERMANLRVRSPLGPTELLIVPGARHAKSLMTDPELWESTVAAFLKKALGEPVKKPPS